MPRPPLIAAAGGVNAGNAEDFARAGAGVLVTSSPYFAPPRDVAVTLRPAP
jgi:molybdenum transport protein